MSSSSSSVSHLRALQDRAQTVADAYQKVQNEISTAVEASQRLNAQLSENELVQKEFAQLTPENVVYKLIGSALVKQDQVDARANVDKRLEFIRSEIKRFEQQLTGLKERSDKLQLELVEMQMAMQQQQGGPQAAPATVTA
ncbi:Prefoldin subunit 6 [Sparassis crispa]|uniref:Prefoldin subunit 6 n=1 Tax=Sparassis crispa TaxID=139825 RepID=A0A401G9E5_9APHY|nr:Prefoldin subunit 6 [Sparassis crispa]GBE78790.1 Prefoldin subunit 6 [Sparassis crispa]